MSRTFHPPRRPHWDNRRRVDPRFLTIQFMTCVGSWTALVFALNGRVSPEGLTASVITGALLVVVSWAMTKLGWNVPDDQPREAALST